MRRMSPELRAAMLAGALATGGVGGVRAETGHPAVVESQKPPKAEKKDGHHGKSAHEHHESHALKIGADALSTSVNGHETSVGAALTVEVPVRLGEADGYVGGRAGMGVQIENATGRPMGHVLSADVSAVFHPDALGKVPLFFGGQAGVEGTLPSTGRTAGIKAGGGLRVELHPNKNLVFGAGLTVEGGRNSELINPNPQETKHGGGPGVKVDLSAGARVDIPWLSGKK